MIASPSTRFGYIDESVHLVNGLYLIALVRADPSLEERVRRCLAACIPTPQRPHWHGENEATRDLLIQVVTALPVEARVYGCRFVAPSRQEAARARALRWGVQELGKETRHLVIDRRQEQQNAVDRKVLGGVAGRPPGFTFAHCSSAGSPMLWLPDIVAGAVAAHLVRGDERHVKALGAIIERVECELVAS